jgi:hypothetical protein
VRKRHRLKLLAAYFVASLVALWAPESVLCRLVFVLPTIPALVYWVVGSDETEVRELRNLLIVCPLVLFLSHYPSTVDSEVFGFTIEEQSEIFGRLNGRARGLEFIVQGEYFLDKDGRLRFSTTLPSGLVNQLSARTLRLREHDLSLRGQSEPFDKSVYELAFRAGLRQELSRKLAASR